MTSHTARRSLTGVTVIAASALLLAACGSNSSGGTGAVTTSNGNPPDAAYRMSTVNGKIASVGADGVAVTTTSGTSNVAFGSATRFTTVATASRSDVKAGDCIAVTSKNGGFGATAVTATTVSITGTTKCPTMTQRTDGLPGGGMPPGGEVPGGDAPPQGGEFGSGTSAPNSGGPTGTPPTGTPRRAFGGAAGTVTSVSNSAINITSANGTPTTVTTTSDTTYSTRKSGTVSDATAGRCLAAFGQKSGTTLDAATVTISTPTNGKCATVTPGMGGFGGGPGQLSGGPNG
jgi:hypothetical protein